jgi:hypothetical protein
MSGIVDKSRFRLRAKFGILDSGVDEEQKNDLITAWS